MRLDGISEEFLAKFVYRQNSERLRRFEVTEFTRVMRPISSVPCGLVQVWRNHARNLFHCK